MNNLDSFVTFSRPPPQIIATSQEIRDKACIFIANVFRASTPEQARTAINHLKHVVHAAKPAYEMSAWRCMVVKPGRSGLEGPEDFELSTGFDDGGERWSGGRILKAMQTEAVIDAVVIVSRWYGSLSQANFRVMLILRPRYGGEQLGPVRFTHIETCAQEAIRTFKRKEELEDIISTLSTLDNILDTLRIELKSLSDTPTETKAKVSSQRSTGSSPYSTWTVSDLPKARRLVGARENAIKSVRNLLAKKKAGMQP